VVTSARTLSALNVEPGRELLVADTPEAFALELLKVMESQEFRTRLGNAGHAYVQKHHHWNNIARELVAIYQGVAGT
jgi:glycosyltransferase involved in cell wall biosynthesis